MNLPRAAAPGSGPGEFALRLAPVAVCLAFFWTGIRCWFFQDDFAWLGLGLEVHSPADLLRTLFEPKAQGTIRPWSERAYFLGLHALFGLDALPFRIVAFLTHAVNLWLAGSIAAQLTGSRLASFVAPLLWGLNAALAVPLTWTSSYNQILVSAFILGAFHFFLKYIETGNRRYYFLQFGIFVLGFGALEINVVYPALASSYALLAARRHLLSTLPLGAVSIVYTLLHVHFAPKVQAGTYRMYLDESIAETLLRYWTNAFAWPRLAPLVEAGWIRQLAGWVPWLLTAVLLLFLAGSLRRGNRAALFPFLWFVIAITPVLPLRDHFSDYYLVVPVLGLSFAAAAAFAGAWNRDWLGRSAAVALAGLYLAGSLPVARSILRFNHDRSKQVRDLVWSVERARELHPNKAILLNGVGTTVYWAGINDNPFRILGITDIWLTPGSEDQIQAYPDLGDVSEFVLPPVATLRALERNEAVVYNASSYPIRNITRRYQAMAQSQWKREPARRVDAGHRYFADHFGTGWHPIESGYRWMGRRAVVWLGAPRSGEARIHLVGYCPAAQLSAGPLQLAVAVNGLTLPTLEITQPDAQFRYEAALPEQAAKSGRLEIVLGVDRTLPDSPGKELGLAFGTLAVK